MNEEEAFSMRNPNGYGSVARLSGNRRRPFVARKTRGWDDRGYPVYETIGYFCTREEGMLALADYNKCPFDVAASRITMEELFEKWRVSRMPKLSPALARALRSAYAHCASITGMRYKDVRAFHMQSCIDTCGHGYSTQWSIKNLFGHLDRFAMELDVIQKSYSTLTTAAAVPETSKHPFTDAEVAALWALRAEPWVDAVLTLLYGGWRISELLQLETANVDLSSETIRGGVKTRSGRNRLVPIHPRILPLICARAGEGGRYLFSYRGQKCSNTRFYVFWRAIMARIGCDHTPHECRHTFRSRLDSAGANKVCIDLMMGHKSREVGERVYTHKTIAELHEAIRMIEE